MALPIRRPGQGGGFLNGVSGAIQAITFEAGKSGETKSGNSYTAYSLKLLIQPDGADPVEQYAPAGFLYGNNTISKDGRSIEGADNYSLDGGTAAGKFVISMVEGEGNRAPEELLGDLRNYDALAGIRVTFARVRDEEETKRRGKRTDKKTGKEYDRDVLLVSEVLALPEVKGKAKGAAKATATKAAAPKATAAADTDAADAALKAVLGAAANQTLPRTSISSSFIRYALAAKIEGEAREAIRKMLTSDDYIADAAKREVIVVDGDGKSANLVLAA